MNANKQDAGGEVTNPDNVGGLRDLLRETYNFLFGLGSVVHPSKHEYVTGLAKRIDKAAGELCRAAPAGGDVPDVLHPQYRHGFEAGMIFEGEHGLMTTNAPKRDSVPAGGDVCATCQGHGMIGWHTGQTPEQFDQHEAPCPDCSAPAGSGEVDDICFLLEQASEIPWHLCHEPMPKDEANAMRRAAALLRKLQQGADYETPSIECYSYDGDQWFDAPDDVELVAGRRAGDTFELMVSHYSIQRKYVVKKAPDSFGDDYEVEPVRAASQGQEGGTNG